MIAGGVPRRKDRPHRSRRNRPAGRRQAATPGGIPGKGPLEFRPGHGRRPTRLTYVRTSPYFTATVDRDGTFRIDDVPAGNYSLSARLEHQGQVGRLRSRRFTVPAANGNRADQPVDLGVLTMEKP